ncbi:MAG: serine O-acetyltransferase, partial [Bacteroidales bacterium]
LYRYGGGTSFKATCKAYIKIPGFRYMFWFRIASYQYKFFLGGISWVILKHYSYLFGIEIPRGTNIGKGFYIGHFSGIIVSGAAIIGDNCNISQGVTIGVAGKGERRGVPQIGNHVYMAPGVKIIGKIKIGNHVAIGANAVVTKDVPDYAVVVGIPAKVISMEGSDSIIENKV